MEHIKFTVLRFSLNRFCKWTDITSEPNYFTFPEKLPTVKALLLSLEFSDHQEICTRWTETSNGTNRNPKFPGPLYGNTTALYNGKWKEINKCSMRKKAF
jgi:hypothetical protein